jgi:branched-chain amino acid transport system substrate-binding protein
VGINVPYFVNYMTENMKMLQNEFGFNRVYIMHQDVLWARGSAGAFNNILGKAGWSVLGVEAYPTGASDFSSGLMKAQVAGTQIILPIFDMDQAGILVRQWRSMRIPALMAGIIVPLAGTDAWRSFEGKIAGSLNMIFEIGSIPVPKVPESVRYFENYKKRWGEEVQEQHGPAPSYDSVYMLADAIERAGSLDPDAVVEALKKTDRNGAIGRIRFNETNQVIFGNDPSETAMGCMIQWSEEGKRIIVNPKSIATHKVVLPDWIKPAK